MLITAAIATALPGEGAPKEIVYIPEGTSEITPLVNGRAAPEPIKVNVDPERGREIAAKLQADLEKRMADNVRPWVDFEHKNGKSSGNPTGFRYEEGRGIVMALDWSKSGRESIEGKDFSYFSPRFDLGDNGAPTGLPDRGPVGGLVNEPAFRDIPRIAAKDAGEEPNNHEVMATTILATCGLLSADEAARKDAEDIARKRVEAMNGDSEKIKKLDAEIEALKEERDKLKKENEEIEAKQAEERKGRAKQLVEAAQADGRIAPKDEETAKKFRERIEAGDTFAEEILGDLPKRNDNLGTPIISAGAQKPGGGDGEHAFQSEAKTAGGSIAKGARVKWGTGGKVVSASAGDKSHGIKLTQGSSADGDIIEIIVLNEDIPA